MAKRESRSLYYTDPAVISKLPHILSSTTTYNRIGPCDNNDNSCCHSLLSRKGNEDSYKVCINPKAGCSVSRTS